MYHKGDRIVSDKYGAGTCTTDSYSFGGRTAVSVQFDKIINWAHNPLVMLDTEVRPENVRTE